MDEKRKAHSSNQEKIDSEAENMARRADRLGEEIEHLVEKTKELRHAMTPKPGCLVVAEDMMYSGTTVSFGRVEFRVPLNGLSKTVLKVSGGKVTQSGFSREDSLLLSF